MRATDGRQAGTDRGPSLLEELIHPIGDPHYPFGIVARPAIQLPVLCLLLLVGLSCGGAAVVLAVSGESVGERQDPAAAVALAVGGVAVALLGLVVGAGTEMFRQARTNGWTRPTPRQEVPPLDAGTLRGLGYLVAVGGVGTSIIAGVILVAGWDLSPLATLACGLVLALLPVALVAWRLLRR
ncbi:hypothetical protein [Ornithinimicrobium faecis]|uniref:hypothetical protein n=1 Tax=Ornithinimicrobium faecis TaxID=2934158 RepID=UPI00211926F2|nr:hypothetical protein [Ornithinimicrobium sp. HY1745]